MRTAQVAALHFRSISLLRYLPAYLTRVRRRWIKDHQHQNKENACNNPDNCRCVHFDYPLSRVWINLAQAVQSTQAPPELR